MAGRMPSMRRFGAAPSAGARRAFGQPQGSLCALARGNATVAAPLRSGAATTASLNRSLEQAHGLLQRQRLDGHRHHLHTTSPLFGDDDKVAKSRKREAPQPTKIGRMVYTCEVAVSKIFPAGFGWQYSSGVAEETFGLTANDYGFFFATGFGDFCGVFAGHWAYYTGKRILYDPSIRVGEQGHVALWLAAAAAASGGAWQPFVNFFQACSGEGNHFNSHVMAVVGCCGTMFYGGLRLGRYFFSPVLTGIPRADYNNLRADAQLAVAIGGATGCFVGTDVSYGDANWLRPLIGVEDGMGNIHGCVLAGTSTALGFTAVQIAENIAYPMGTCWVD